jgi:endonuclease/exonuclease/phosphatase family metal-dependent hydrolase
MKPTAALHRKSDIAALCLNIRFGLSDDGNNSWPYRKQAFSGLLAAYPADFICLQEVNDFQAEYINTLLPHHRLIGKRFPAPDFWQNNIIFYEKSWECLHAAHFFLSPTPDIPSRARESQWPRQCTLGVFKRSHRKLICINTHLDFKPAVRIQSAQIIMQRLSAMPAGIPTLLMGDFNASIDCPCHAVLTERQINSDLPIFQNVVTASDTGTYHGFSGISDSDPIDWILFRGDITLVNFKIIRDTFDGYFPSDHFPLYASFRWG